MAPLVIRDHLLVGTSGDFDNLPRMLKSIDPETGDTQWTFYSTLAREAPEAFSGGATGGNMWITGTYDPQLNLFYVGTGNPTPVLAAAARPGDNPWTCSIVALIPTTANLFGVPNLRPTIPMIGMPSRFQSWWTESSKALPTRCCCKPRGTVISLCWTALAEKACLPRPSLPSTGPWVWTGWASDPNPAKEPARDGRLIAPDEGGATNYRSPSFDMQTGLFIVQRAG